MTVFRLATYFILAQCFIAGAAFAGTVTLPEPSSLALLAAGVGGVALGRKFLKRK